MTAPKKPAVSNLVRVYMAMSLDGFIAGPNNDLSWLPGSQDNDSSAQGDDAHGNKPKVSEQGDSQAIGYDAFFSGVGAMLMGRTTHDVVRGFGGPWPYAETPVLVASHRDIEGAAPSVRRVEGTIHELIKQAKAAAGTKNVYLDGGVLIRQALEAGLIDDLIITVAPIVLGEGIPLFAGLLKHQRLEFTGHHSFDYNMVQLHARPLK